MNRFRLSDLSSRDRLASTLPTSHQGKKQKSQKLKSPRSSSPEFNSCHCEALSENKVCIIYSFKISDWKCLVPVVVV
jgi:hypothetical protein